MNGLIMTRANFSSTAAGLATLLGATAVLFGPLRPDVPTFAALILCGSAALAAAAVQRLGVRGPLGDLLRAAQPWLWTVALASLAALVTLGVALDQLAQRWPADDAGARVIAQVTIDSLTRQAGGGVEFDAALSIESPASAARELRARVIWHDAPQPAPRAGEQWRLLLRLSAPRTNTNPGGFDEQREFFRDRLQARAVVLPFAGNQRQGSKSAGVLVLRERITERIREAVTDRDAAALFAGLAVGATGAVSREQWRVFSVTGTTHLVAISGMHVTLFCWIVVALMRRLWGRLPLLVVRVDREAFAATLGVSAAFAYAVLAGFGIPTQRTVVMLAVWWLLKLSGRVHAPFDVLGLAVIAVLLIDPLGPLSSGFWLSFVAMATLIAAGETGGNGWRAWLVENLRTQWRVGIALLPLTIAWFQNFSLAGLVVNLLAIPIFSFVLVPVALLGSALGSLSAKLAAPIWWLGERAHDFLWPALVAVAEHPLAALELDMPRWQLLLVAVLVAAVIVADRLPGRWARSARFGGLAILLLAILWPASIHERPRAGEVMVTTLDAGDAAAFVVRTRHHAMLIDTGETFGSEGGGAERLVLPALREFGLDQLDVLVLGATHAYRAAGAAAIMASIEVKQVIAGGEWPGARHPIEDCAERRRWEWDGVVFETFAVPGGACLVRLGFPAGPVLLMAERLSTAEAVQLATTLEATSLLATLLVAPRRGSAAGHDSAFASAVDPQWLLLPGRDGSAQRVRTVAQRWGVEPARVVATAARGAYTLHLRAGLPPRWIDSAALQGSPIWRYHPLVMQDRPRI